jgi:hypothetical protein
MGKQHFLYFFPLPHGQGSFLPIRFIMDFVRIPIGVSLPSAYNAQNQPLIEVAV